MKNKPRKMTQLKQGHEDVYSCQRRAQSLEFKHHLQLGKKLLISRPITHTTEWEDKLLDHLDRGNNERGKDETKLAVYCI